MNEINNEWTRQLPFHATNHEALQIKASLIIFEKKKKIVDK